MTNGPGFIRLAQEIRADVAAATSLFEELMSRLDSLGDDPVSLSYIALSLHRIYTAVESAFERIARTLEGSLPVGADHHQALLRSMALTLPSIRPQVLRESTVIALRPLLKFRHFLRHAYAMALEQKRLLDVVTQARESWPDVKDDLDAFIDFLERAAIDPG